MRLKLYKPKEIELKDGRVISIRKSKITDAIRMIAFVNSLIGEDAMIEDNEPKSIASPELWFKFILKRLGKIEYSTLIAECNGELVGVAELRKGTGRRSHVAHMGIGVKREYRRLGIGTELMKAAIELGKKDKSIRVIYLDAYAGNKPAISMYKKLGFKKVANLKNRVKYKGKLGDMLIMDYRK
jgi:ribosomal protein S18 acetylase RimI-like enzyme